MASLNHLTPLRLMRRAWLEARKDFWKISQDKVRLKAFQEGCLV